ncbi:MAG: hypothetical protein H6525_03640 [Actinobacteria bacterium]|nr:hypothetical protein [Actinomycetota bacterium]
MATRVVPRWTGRALALAVAATLLAGCAGDSSTDDAWEQRGLPGGARPSDRLVLAVVEPDDGVGPVVDFIDSATTSVALGTYEINPDYAPIVDALTRAIDRGVDVRVMVSATEYPLTGPQGNPADVAALQQKGIDAQLSNPAFSYYHAKFILLDAGQPSARAMVTDFNFDQGYFEADPTHPDEGGTRGMAVLATDPDDVAEIASYFEADWPPFGQWPPPDRPNVIWAPSSDQFPNPGNAERVMRDLIGGATETLDIYEQQFPVASELLDPILQRAKAGVKVRIIGNRVGFDPKVAEVLEPAGVEIVFGPAAADGRELYIHTKTIVVDAGSPDQVAYIGSVNPFLAESLQTERELGVLVTDNASIEEVSAVFDKDFATATANL